MEEKDEPKEKEKKITNGKRTNWRDDKLREGERDELNRGGIGRSLSLCPPPLTATLLPHPNTQETRLILSIYM